MKSTYRLRPLISGIVTLATLSPVFAVDFANNGLVGVGRVSADSFDQLGAGVDTLGGIFSSMWFDQTSLQVTANPGGGYTYEGTLLSLPDRGFGDGAQDYHPRIQTFDFRFTPVPAGYSGPALPQTQIQLVNTATTLLTDERGATFTGFNADDSSVTAYPSSAVGSLGDGRRSLDPEGLVRLSDGSTFISDEYGPNVYRFNAAGQLQETLDLPEALVPRKGGALPRPYTFDANTTPDSGRRGNRGMEGLSVSPDEKLLFAMLQSPTVQDGGAGNDARNTRILVYDLTKPGTPLVGEYVYQLTLNGNPAGTRNTPISEILALNDHEILVLERDGRGLGQGNAPTYKSIVKVDVRGASNLLGTGYDLELGAPGQESLPKGVLPASVTAVAREDLVNMLDAAQLAKFGLNINASPDSNSLSEKWEGLALIPRLETSAVDDFYLLVGNDNDFLTSQILHNGDLVGGSALTIDNMILAYDVTLPGAFAQGFSAAVPDALPGWAALSVMMGLVWLRPRKATV